MTIPAGFKGVKTLVSAPLPETPNEVIVPKGKEARGVQTETFEPGTQYLNPYVTDVALIDCRSQQYNLEDIGFSTRDGFWVSLEGVIEFRVNPKEAAKVFVLYNEGKNNAATDDEAIQKMVIEKIIVPNARAYTRLKGSSHSGKEFITGDTRATFQEDFQREMQSTCAAQGIEVIQALITNDQAAGEDRRPGAAAADRPAEGEAISRRRSCNRRPNRIWPCKRRPCCRSRPRSRPSRR